MRLKKLFRYITDVSVHKAVQNQLKIKGSPLAWEGGCGRTKKQRGPLMFKLNLCHCFEKHRGNTAKSRFPEISILNMFLNWKNGKNTWKGRKSFLELDNEGKFNGPTAGKK